MRSSLSTTTQIKLTWNVEPDTDSAITGYSLEYDPDGNDNYSEIWNGRGRPDVLTYSVSVTTGRLYSFRHRVFNSNGPSTYSTPLQLYACVQPSSPGKPQWVTSTASTITFVWDSPVDNGGCPIIEYKAYSDLGGTGSVTNEIQASVLAGLSNVNGLVVTDLPVLTPGLYYTFKVTVFTTLSQ